jgi:hypothetical protein
MQEPTKFRVFTLIAMMMMAGAAFGQVKRQSETAKQIAAVKEQVALLEEKIALMRDPANVEAKYYEADSDEYKVRVFRTSLKVPARAASKGVKARKAATVLTDLKIEVIYHVATAQRRESQIEAAALGADLSEAIKIDRETFELDAEINGKTTEMTMRYYAGKKLVASRDLMTGDTGQARATIDRISKLDKWAHLSWAARVSAAQK